LKEGRPREEACRHRKRNTRDSGEKVVIAGSTQPEELKLEEGRELGVQGGKGVRRGAQLEN